MAGRPTSDPLAEVCLRREICRSAAGAEYEMSVSPRELPSAQDRHGARQAQDALIGREAELDALRVFVDQVVADGAVLLISGDAGVGKTVLLDAAADLASAAGARVVRSAGVQFEIDISYSGLNQLLLPLLSGLQDLNEDHRNALMVALGLAAGAPPNASSSAPPACRCSAARRPAVR